MTRPARTIPPTSHGTQSGYRYWGCRCDRCRAAVNAAANSLRLRRAEQPIPRHVHGTPNGYSNYSCRCEACQLGARARRLARKLWPADTQ